MTFTEMLSSLLNSRPFLWPEKARYIPDFQAVDSIVMKKYKS